MDNTYQDIHICNRRESREIIYRQLRISKIVFGEETIFIYYKDHNNVDMTMGIPKDPHIKLIVD